MGTRIIAVQFSSEWQKKGENRRVQRCVNVVCDEYQSYVMTLLYAAEELNNSYLLDMQSRILKSALSSKFVIKLGKVHKLQWEGNETRPWEVSYLVANSRQPARKGRRDT